MNSVIKSLKLLEADLIDEAFRAQMQGESQRARELRSEAKGIRQAMDMVEKSQNA